jgi:hypothetical protein
MRKGRGRRMERDREGEGIREVYREKLLVKNDIV